MSNVVWGLEHRFRDRLSYDKEATVLHQLFLSAPTYNRALFGRHTSGYIVHCRTIIIGIFASNNSRDSSTSDLSL